MSVNIPPLPPTQPPWPQFQVWWQQVIGAIESQIGALETAEAALAAAVAAQASANAAQTTANTAVTNAAAAQTTANTANLTAATVKRDDAISTSWVSPGTALSASDAGSDATVTIATHTRHYSNTDTSSVTGSSITGLSYSTTYYVYYDQTSRAGGAVTYHATTDPNTALPGAAAGRHYVGTVTTPASGGTATTGTGSSGGGGGSFSGSNIP